MCVSNQNQNLDIPTPIPTLYPTLEIPVIFLGGNFWNHIPIKPRKISSNNIMGLKKTYPSTKHINRFSKFATTREISMGNFYNFYHLCKEPKFCVGHFLSCLNELWNYGSLFKVFQTLCMCINGRQGWEENIGMIACVMEGW